MPLHHQHRPVTPEENTHRGLPEVAPHAANPYEEDDHPAKQRPDKQGELPRKPDDSKDHQKDPDQPDTQ